MAPKQKAMPRPPTGSKWEEMGIKQATSTCSTSLIDPGPVLVGVRFLLCVFKEISLEWGSGK